MNYLKLSIIAVILITIFICIVNPKMHKRVVIGDAKVSIVEDSGYQKQPKTLQQAQKKSKMIRQKGLQAHQPGNKVDLSYQKHFELPTLSKNKTKEVTLAPTQKKQLKIQQVDLEPQKVSKQKQQLTQEEIEIIAWNKWRSDLQNKVMKDTKLSAPIGTVFKFSFTVDREGTISNLKTWSTNSEYTPMAVRVIKPKIIGYQGQSILNFPVESKRVITNVNGGFTIWYSAGYSSPSDYSDYERVK